MAKKVSIGQIIDPTSERDGLWYVAVDGKIVFTDVYKEVVKWVARKEKKDVK